MRKLWSIALGLFILTAAPAFAQNGAAPPEDAPPKIVVVTAEGFNRDDAQKQALRKALEQGGGVQIASYSQAENFTLVRDTIYSRAAAVVSEFRVLEEREGAGGVFIMKIEATVRPSAIAQAWGEVQNVLDQIGRPKILVWIDEYIDGKPQRDSVVASRIEKMFVDSGFDLVDRQAIEDIRKREAADAADEKDAAKLARLAKDANAHIFIRGTASANQAGLEDLYGVPAAFYNCTAQARIYHTDTAKLLVSESMPVTRRGARSRNRFSPEAARAALEAAALPDAKPHPGDPPPLAVRLYESVMQQWATQITSAGEIQLEVSNMDFKTYVELKKALQELGQDRMKSIDGDFTKGTGVFRIRATMSAQQLAELLTEPPFDKMVEVLDLKPYRIQAKKVGT